MMTDEVPIALWGIDTPLAELPGGRRNRAYRCRRAGAAGDLVFKSTTRSAEAIAWLLPVHAAARQAGFVVPEFVPSRAGRLVERGWTCERFMEGAPVAAPLSGRDQAQLCAQIRDFHLLTGELAQRPGFLSSAALQDATVGGDVDLAALPVALSRACRAAWAGAGAEVRATSPEGVIHGDLHAGNLLRNAEGGFVLLDWDECRRDLPFYDLVPLGQGRASERRAALAWEVACCWQQEPDRARALAERLRQSMG